MVGVGVMGETILSGLLRAGYPPNSLIAVDHHPDRIGQIAARYSVNTAKLPDAAAQADTVMVVVKPNDARAVLAEIGAYMRPGTLVVSLCAGLTTAQLEEPLPAGTPVVRVMPNTPAQVSEGMSAVSAGSAASPEHLRQATELMSAVGKAVVVDEKYQDAVTAVSGSGPAYLFLVAESMIDAGVLLGLPRDLATELTVQTMVGSAKLLAETGTHPAILRDRVTSPGGTTAAALRALDSHALKSAFQDAMEAACTRSQELSAP